MRRKTLALDFDGVIHKYSKGWHDGSIYDVMMMGALAGILKLHEKYNLFIFTTRDTSDVTQYMKAYGFNAIQDKDPNRVFWNDSEAILVTNKKLAAHAYVDDRAIRFTNWNDILDTIDELI